MPFIRPAGFADIPAISAILSSCREELPVLSEAGLIPLLRRNIGRGSCVIAEQDGITAGVCVWSVPLSRISLLAVIPEARRKGIASSLLQTALDALPGNIVRVETFQDADPRGRSARALYAKFGFLPEKRLSGYDIPMELLKLRRT